MIEFATLFLGLILGPQHVRFFAHESVAAIEISLDHQVVGHRSAGSGVALQQRDVLWTWSGKRMVHRCPSTSLRIVGKHREVDNP